MFFEIGVLKNFAMFIENTCVGVPFHFYRTPLVVAPDYHTNIRSNKKSKNVVLEEYREKKIFFFMYIYLPLLADNFKDFIKNIFTKYHQLVEKCNSLGCLGYPATGPRPSYSVLGPRPQ